MTNNGITNDIKNGTQQLYKERYYFLNNIEAYTHIGKYRNSQEDAVLIVNKFNNSDFSLMAVADGMGGLKNGAIASHTALYMIYKWFNNLSPEYYQNEPYLLAEVCFMASHINDYIRSNIEGAGTTLSLAITCKHNTLIFNVGDSRIYSYKSNILTQVSDDHSESMKLYKKRIIKNKDDIMYHKKNHLLTSALGSKNMYLVNKKIILNENYDNLFLFTDGITDILTDKQINNVINTHPFQYISKNIVKEALNTDSYQDYLNDDYYQEILGGSDNTTAIAYQRIRK